MKFACRGLTVLLLLWCVEAAAQETVEPTAAQQDFNNQGVVQMQQGKLPEAVAFFRSSLSLGELNVTYLNLGRAYFRLGHCLDARQSYDGVASAPKVNSPSPDEIAGLLARFEKDFAETCSATVKIECEGDPMVSVAGAAARQCSPASSWPVKPGETVVSYSYGKERGTVSTTVEAGETGTVNVSPPQDEPEPVSAAPEPDSTPAPAAPAAADDSSMTTYAMIVGGVGVALIASAFAYDAFVTGPKADELESLEPTNDGVARAEELRTQIDGYQRNTMIMGGVGVAALGTGVVLFLLAPDSDEGAPAASLMLGEDLVGATIRGTW